MATYLEIVGGPAYGDAELQKIKTLAEAEDLSIRQVYYIHLPAAAAQQSTRDELAKVLEESEEVSAEEGFELLYVTPRNTTPWSSNATTIMEVSHLPVSRVEKGRIVKIKAKVMPSSAQSCQTLMCNPSYIPNSDIDIIQLLIMHRASILLLTTFTTV